MHSKKGQATDNILIIATVMIWVVYLMSGVNYIGSLKENTLVEKVVIGKQIATLENVAISAPGNVITSFSTKLTPKFNYDFSNYGQVRIYDKQKIYYPSPYSKEITIERDIFNTPQQIILEKKGNKIEFSEKRKICNKETAKQGDINQIIKYKTEQEIIPKLKKIIFLNQEIEIIEDIIDDLTCVENEIKNKCNYKANKINGYNDKEYQKLGITISIEGDNNVCVDQAFQNYGFRKVGQLTYVSLK